MNGPAKDCSPPCGRMSGHNIVPCLSLGPLLPALRGLSVCFGLQSECFQAADVQLILREWPELDKDTAFPKAYLTPCLCLPWSSNPMGSGERQQAVELWLVPAGVWVSLR